MLCRAKHLMLARLYSGTPLIQSQMGQKKGAGSNFMTWGPYKDKYTVHRIRISWTTVNWTKLLKIFLQYIKHF